MTCKIIYIRVPSCRDCPRRGVVSDTVEANICGDKKAWFCTEAQKSMEPRLDEDIPEWCPLEDY
jgi:hypothetical protein